MHLKTTFVSSDEEILKQPIGKATKSLCEQVGFELSTPPPPPPETATERLPVGCVLVNSGPVFQCFPKTFQAVFSEAAHFLLDTNEEKLCPRLAVLTVVLTTQRGRDLCCRR